MSRGGRNAASPDQPAGRPGGSTIDKGDYASVAGDLDRSFQEIARLQVASVVTPSNG